MRYYIYILLDFKFLLFTKSKETWQTSQMLLSKMSLKVPKPCELQHSVRILQLYKPRHTHEVIPVMFCHRSEILDDVIGCRATGLREIQHYFEHFESVYEDVYVTGIHCFPNNRVHTRWVRRCRDGRDLFGYDHILIENGQYTRIHVHLEKRNR